MAWKDNKSDSLSSSYKCFDFLKSSYFSSSLCYYLKLFELAAVPNVFKSTGGSEVPSSLSEHILVQT